MRARLSVLLVEDSEDDALMIARELKRAGYDVQWARVDGREAMKASLAERRWDVIISDLSLPGFSGNDALKLLRATGSDAPFIVVSGAMGDDTAAAALKDGAQGYVVKTNLQLLAPVVQRELRAVQERRQARSADN